MKFNLKQRKNFTLFSHLIKILKTEKHLFKTFVRHIFKQNIKKEEYEIANYDVFHSRNEKKLINRQHVLTVCCC